MQVKVAYMCRDEIDRSHRAAPEHAREHAGGRAGSKGRGVAGATLWKTPGETLGGERLCGPNDSAVKSLSTIALPLCPVKMFSNQRAV